MKKLKLNLLSRLRKYDGGGNYDRGMSVNKKSIFEKEKERLASEYSDVSTENLLDDSGNVIGTRAIGKTTKSGEASDNVAEGFNYVKGKAENKVIKQCGSMTVPVEITFPELENFYKTINPKSFVGRFISKLLSNVKPTDGFKVEDAIFKILIGTKVPNKTAIGGFEAGCFNAMYEVRFSKSMSEAVDLVGGKRNEPDPNIDEETVGKYWEWEKSVAIVDSIINGTINTEEKLMRAIETCPDKICSSVIDTCFEVHTDSDGNKTQRKAVDINKCSNNSFHQGKLKPITYEDYRAKDLDENKKSLIETYKRLFEERKGQNLMDYLRLQVKAIKNKLGGLLNYCFSCS